MNVPFLYSSNACFSSPSVFITIGPYQATGSPMGLPEINRNLTSPSAARPYLSHKTHRFPSSDHSESGFIARIVISS